MESRHTPPYFNRGIQIKANHNLACITLFCSISITTAASRCTWAFARDDAIPLARLWSRVNKTFDTPVWALILITLVQLLLGLIILGSTSAFNAFVSVGVISLAVSYAIPIGISMWHKRAAVSQARWRLPGIVGPSVNIIALFWVAFEVVLSSMPTALPVTEVSMNYASVVFVGFLALSGIWYIIYTRKVCAQKPEWKDEFIGRIKRDGMTGLLNWYCANTENHQTAAEEEILKGRLKTELPVLCVGCTEDAVCRIDFIDRVKPLLQESTVKVIESGPWCAMEKPEEVGTIMVDFLKERF